MVGLLVLALLLGVANTIGHLSSRVFIWSVKDVVTGILGAMAGNSGVVGLVVTIEWMIARLVGAAVTFDWLAQVLFYASLPAWTGLLLHCGFPLGHRAYRTLQGLSIVATCWGSTLLVVGLRSGTALSWVQLAALALPVIGVYWTACYRAITAPPELICSRVLWRTHRAGLVTLFYPAGMREIAAPTIADRLEVVLRHVALLLGAPLPGFPILVFLFADSQSMNKTLQPDTVASDCRGFMFQKSVFLAISEVEDLEAGAAHEFAHLILQQNSAHFAPGLLDEGLACYAEGLLFGRKRRLADVRLSWRTLSRYTYFYEVQYRDTPELSIQDAYAYAQSIAEHLIDSYGMESYLSLGVRAWTDRMELAGSALDRAMRETYGRPASDLEAEWRAVQKSPAPLGMSVRDLARSARRAARVEARMRTLQARSGRQLELDM